MGKTTRHTITLKPLNVSFKVVHGTSLQDELFDYGVEFPCGGRGECDGCRVKVLSGNLPVTSDEENHLSEKELSAGWRLACRGTVTDNLVIELAQWEASILSDDSTFSFRPHEGFGIAIDIGTTTIVAQLMDLSTGNILAVKTALNKQAQYGADIMERINYAISPPPSKSDLGFLLREQIGSLITSLSTIPAIPMNEIHAISIVGNTAMQHFFCDFDITPLSSVPFEPEAHAFQVAQFRASDLGWDHPESASIQFLPSLGGFVGSDVLAGIIAKEIDKRETFSCLIDLGTNGEIVIGNKNKLLCASTAAGPAFEGARISMGMRAASGAIASVAEYNGKLSCSVIGGSEPKGICGSGLVDAVAVGLRNGQIATDGRIANKKDVWELSYPVTLTQADIRELQLAKAAIAAGITILLRIVNISIHDIADVYLAGAFGNYINRESARAIGLLPFPVSKITPVGNTALLGAKRALFLDDFKMLTSIQKLTSHIPLGSNAAFMDVFVQEMSFPTSA